MTHANKIRNTVAASILLSITSACSVEDGMDGLEAREMTEDATSFDASLDGEPDDASDEEKPARLSWQDRMSRDEARQRLLGRIGPDTERIQLGTRELPLRAGEREGGFERDQFARVLEDMSGAMIVDANPGEITSVTADVGGKGWIWEAASATHRIVVTGESRVSIAGRRTYERGLSDQTDEKVFRDDAEKLAEAFGALPSELGEPYLFRIGAFGKSEIGGVRQLGEGSALVQMVRYYRSVGGIPVQGNDLTVGFHLDGELGSLRGRWPAVDYGASQLASDLTLSDVRLSAVDALLDAGHDPDDEAPISIVTFYKVVMDEDTGEYVLDLQAEVSAHTGLADETGVTLDRVLDI